MTEAVTGKESTQPPKETKPESHKIDPLLLEKVGDLRGIISVSNILGTGFYSYAQGSHVHTSMRFLEMLHRKILNECLNHPDAALVPELRSVQK